MLKFVNVFVSFVNDDDKVIKITANNYRLLSVDKIPLIIKFLSL